MSLKEKIKQRELRAVFQHYKTSVHKYDAEEYTQYAVAILSMQK